jgi:hypothetical protein
MTRSRRIVPTIAALRSSPRAERTALAMSPPAAPGRNRLKNAPAKEMQRTRPKGADSHRQRKDERQKHVHPGEEREHALPLHDLGALRNLLSLFQRHDPSVPEARLPVVLELHHRNDERKESHGEHDAQDQQEGLLHLK